MSPRRSRHFPYPVSPSTSTRSSTPGHNRQCGWTGRGERELQRVDHDCDTETAGVGEVVDTTHVAGRDDMRHARRQRADGDRRTAVDDCDRSDGVRSAVILKRHLPGRYSGGRRCDDRPERYGLVRVRRR